MSACADFDCPSESTLMDGLLENALCFKDCNCNQLFDAVEPYSRTNANGVCKLIFEGHCSGNMSCVPEIYAVTDSGTVDKQSGAVLSGLTLRSACPNGTCDGIVVSPISTLIQASGSSASAISQMLGLPSNIDVATFNPFSQNLSQNLSESAALLKLSNNYLTTAVTAFSSVLGAVESANDNVVENAFSAIANVIANKSSSNDTLDLRNASDVALIGDELYGIMLTKNLSVSSESLSAVFTETAAAVSNVNEVIDQASSGNQSAVSGALSNIAVLQSQLANSVDAVVKNASTSMQLPFSSLEAVISSASNLAPTDISLSGSEVVESSSNMSNFTVGHATTIDDFTLEGNFVYGLSGRDAERFSIGETSGLLKLVPPPYPDFESTPQFEIVISSTDEGDKSFAKQFLISVIDVNCSVDHTECTTSSVVSTAHSSTEWPVQSTTGFPNATGDFNDPAEPGAGILDALGVGGLAALAVAGVVIIVVTIVLAVVLSRRQKADNDAASPHCETDKVVPSVDEDSSFPYSMMDDPPAEASSIDVFFDEDEKKREEAWQLTRSMRFLNQSLATEAGQQTLQNIADLYYGGDTKKARAYLVFQLQNEVKSAKSTSESPEASTEEDTTTEAGSSAETVQLPQPTDETADFVNELVHVMDKLDTFSQP